MKLIFVLGAITLLGVQSFDFKDPQVVTDECVQKTKVERDVVAKDEKCEIEEIENAPNYKEFLDCYATTMGFLDEDKNVNKTTLYEYKKAKLGPGPAQAMVGSCSEVGGKREEKALNLRKCICKIKNKL